MGACCSGIPKRKKGAMIVDPQLAPISAQNNELSAKKETHVVQHSQSSDQAPKRRSSKQKLKEEHKDKESLGGPPQISSDKFEAASTKNEKEIVENVERTEQSISYEIHRVTQENPPRQPVNAESAAPKDERKHSKRKSKKKKLEALEDTNAKLNENNTPLPSDQPRDSFSNLAMEQPAPEQEKHKSRLSFKRISKKKKKEITDDQSQQRQPSKLPVLKLPKRTPLPDKSATEEVPNAEATQVKQKKKKKKPKKRKIPNPIEIVEPRQEYMFLNLPAEASFKALKPLTGVKLGWNYNEAEDNYSYVFYLTEPDGLNAIRKYLGHPTLNRLRYGALGNVYKTTFRNEETVAFVLEQEDKDPFLLDQALKYLLSSNLKEFQSSNIIHDKDPFNEWGGREDIDKHIRDGKLQGCLPHPHTLPRKSSANPTPNATPRHSPRHSPRPSPRSSPKLRTLP